MYHGCSNSHSPATREVGKRLIARSFTGIP